MQMNSTVGRSDSPRGVRQLRVIALALTLFAGGISASTFGPMLMREMGLASVAAQDAATPVAVEPQPQNTCFVDSDGVQAEPWMRSELFFGTTKDDGTAYSNDEWLAFLENEVTPRFPDGLTVLTGLGQWRDSESSEVLQERSNVLIILYPLSSAQDASTKLEEIRDAYEDQFNQSSVLRADDGAPVCTSF
ncbi:MAG: hypothetical protein QOF01_4442 [Thermomicrobiales bacterium]|nr:hypothetical protein [Thermomicrobiales bacterium]